MRLRLQPRTSQKFLILFLDSPFASSSSLPHFLWYIWKGRDSDINSHIFNFPCFSFLLLSSRTSLEQKKRQTEGIVRHLSWLLRISWKFQLIPKHFQLFFSSRKFARSRKLNPWSFNLLGCPKKGKFFIVRLRLLRQKIKFSACLSIRSPIPIIPHTRPKLSPFHFKL